MSPSLDLESGTSSAHIPYTAFVLIRLQQGKLREPSTFFLASAVAEAIDCKLVGDIEVVQSLFTSHICVAIPSDMVELVFIQQDKHSEWTQKRKEQERAKALAHAASIGHQRRRRRQQSENKLIRSRAVDLIPSSRGQHKRSAESWTNFVPHDSYGLRVDPFDCMRDKRTANVSMVLDHHATITAPNHIPIYSIFNVTNVFTSYYTELLCREGSLHAGVASVHAGIDQLRRPGMGPSSETLQHLNKAIIELRETLDAIIKKSLGSSEAAALISESTIMTVMFMAVCARVLGDTVAHEAHKRTVASLVAAKGGLDKLTGQHGLARCALMQLESFWALNSGATIFPSNRPTYNPQYPSIPFSESVLRQIKTLPIGFQTLAQTRMLAADVIEVLARATAAQTEFDSKGTYGDFRENYMPKIRRYSDFWEACTCLGAPDEVVTFKCEDGGTEGISSPNLQKLIVLALILHCSNSLSHTRAASTIYNGSRIKLISDLPRKFAVSKQYQRLGRKSVEPGMAGVLQRETDVLLWISLVLVDSWRTVNGVPTPQSSGLMKMTRDHFAEVSMWAEIEVILRKFFWNKKFLGRCESSWLSTT